jgi:hypothetical protein
MPDRDVAWDCVFLKGKVRRIPSVQPDNCMERRTEGVVKEEGSGWNVADLAVV